MVTVVKNGDIVSMGSQVYTRCINPEGELSIRWGELEWRDMGPDSRFERLF